MANVPYPSREHVMDAVKHALNLAHHYASGGYAEGGAPPLPPSAGLAPPQNLRLGEVANINPSKLMFNYQGGQGGIPIRGYAKTPNLSPIVSPGGSNGSGSGPGGGSGSGPGGGSGSGSGPGGGSGGGGGGGGFQVGGGGPGGGEGPTIRGPGNGGEQGGIDPTIGMGIGDIPTNNLGSGFRLPTTDVGTTTIGGKGGKGGAGGAGGIGGAGGEGVGPGLGVDNVELAKYLTDYYNNAVNMPINIEGEGEGQGFLDKYGSKILGLAPGLGPAIVTAEILKGIYKDSTESNETIDPKDIPNNTDAKDSILNVQNEMGWDAVQPHNDAYAKQVGSDAIKGLNSDNSFDLSNDLYSQFAPNQWQQDNFSSLNNSLSPWYNSMMQKNWWETMEPDSRGGSVTGKNYGGAAADAPYDSHAVIQNALRLLSKRG